MYERYLLQQGSSPDNVESFIGKFFYWEERGLCEGENWTTIDSLIPQFLPSIPSRSRLSPLVWMVMVLFTREFTYALSLSQPHDSPSNSGHVVSNSSWAFQ